MSFAELPDHPGPLVQQWLAEARTRSGVVNWNMMMLSTVGQAGKPSVRAVLLKEHDPDAVTFTFFTNYHSRKGREMEANSNVAAAMYWDSLERQVRIEGVAVKTSPAISDAYFATRPRESQIGAWASQQSEPIESYDELLARAQQVATAYEGRPIPRPPHWGGYMIVADAVEFWHGMPGRIHERVVFLRNQRGENQWTRRWLNP